MPDIKNKRIRYNTQEDKIQPNILSFNGDVGKNLGGIMLKKKNRTKRSQWGVILLLIGLCFSPWCVSAETSVEALFEEAIIQETGERNLIKAMDLFKQVIEQTGDGSYFNIKAKFQVGICLEKLRQWKEAVSWYQSMQTEGLSANSEDAYLLSVYLKRAQSELEKNKSNKSDENKKWDIGTDISTSMAAESDLKEIPALWLYAGKGIGSGGRLGVEGAYFIPKESLVGGFCINGECQKNEYSGAIVNLYYESPLREKRFNVFFRGGLGLLYTDTKRHRWRYQWSTREYEKDIQRSQYGYPLLSMGIGCVVKLNDLFSLKLTLREHFTIRRRSTAISLLFPSVGLNCRF